MTIKGAKKERAAKASREEPAAEARQAAARPGRRLPPQERRKLIVEEAVRFFAEHGFSGQTRELAERIGVTQPLLYRYFPTKQDLIEEVYKEVYLRRWSLEWEQILDDRSQPLRGRLIAFYKSYTNTIFAYDWMRIYMFSGLMGAEINRRYIKIVEDRLLRRICREFRAEYKLASEEEKPISSLEMELVWHMHGGIFYYGIRKFIYGIPVASDLDTVIEQFVATLFEGIPTALSGLVRQD